MDLAQQKCVACRGGIPAFSRKTAEWFLKKVKNWKLFSEKRVLKIQKEFFFKDFVQAMQFVNKVANLAEKEGHHPDIFVSWNKVLITIFTHKIKGLHENDFILAAKIDLI